MLEVAVLQIIVVRREKLQPNHHHHSTNMEFLQTGCPFCHANKRCQSTEVKIDILQHPATGLLM